MNQPLSVTVTRRYQQRLNLIGRHAGARMSDTWDQLGQWDDGDVGDFTTAASPIVKAAQHQAGVLTAGYIGVLLGSRLAANIDPSRFLDDIDFRSPFLAYWGALNRGDPWEKAVSLGRSQAELLAVDGATIAARGTASDIDATEDRIEGWDRVPDGVCCEWCAGVAEQTYRTADSATFGHDRCNCGVIPIIGNLRPGRTINRDLAAAAASDSTGYVNTLTGGPAPRPADTPVVAP